MPKWEYKHVELVERDDGTLNGLAINLQRAVETQVEWDLARDQIDGLLDTHGHWGWELVAATEPERGGSTRLYFKRPVED